MNSKYKKLIKDTLIFALGNIGSKFIIFFLVPLYTHCLTTEEYGSADFIFTIAQIFVPVVSLVIFDAVIRFGLEHKEHPENVLLVSLLVGSCGSILFLLFLPLLSLHPTIQSWKWYMYFYIVSNVFLSIFLNYLKVKGKNLIYSLICIVQTGVLALLNILFLVIFRWGVSGYLLANVCAGVTALIVAFFFGGVIRDAKVAKFDKVLFKQMIKYSSPLIFNNLAWWIIQSSDKIMIQVMVGLSALGLYTVATRIPSLINVVVSIFQQSWGISAVLEMDSSNQKDFYTNILRIYTCGVFGACMVLNAIIKPFMALYVGNDFFTAWKFVPFLIIAAAFSAVAAYYGSMYGALKKSVNNMISTVLAAVINIIFNYIMILRIGAFGAIVGTCMAYVFLAFYRMFDVNRCLNLQIDMKKFMLNILVMFVQAFFITIDFYKYLVSFAMIIIFLWINRQMIKEIFNTLIIRRVR